MANWNSTKQNKGKAHRAGMPAGDQPASGSSSMSCPPATRSTAPSSPHVPPSSRRAWSQLPQPTQEGPLFHSKIPPPSSSMLTLEQAQHRQHALPAGAGPPSRKSCPEPGRFNSCLRSQPREWSEAKFSLPQIISWMGRGPPLIAFPC